MEGHSGCQGNPQDQLDELEDTRDAENAKYLDYADDAIVVGGRGCTARARVVDAILSPHLEVQSISMRLPLSLQPLPLGPTLSESSLVDARAVE